MDGKVRRENTFVLNANRKSDACAFGFEDDAYSAQVVGGVGTDRAAQVSDEMWALSREPAGQSTQYKRRPLCCRLWLFVSPPTERSAVMSQEKYIGMDVHRATISVAVLDSRGKLIMESILETKAATILEFLQGLHGSLSVTFEEGNSAAWLHDLLKPHVTRLVVCDPRKNALLKDGSKSDRIDARKLAELLQPAHVGLPRRARDAAP
jgi:hypothetical protein